MTGHLGDASPEDAARDIGALLFDGERVEAKPISKEIGRGADIAGVQRTLAAGVCR